MEHLLAYLRKKGITQAQAARDLGISKSYMSEIASGETTPGLQLAIKLQDWSKGAVPVTCWRTEASKCA